MTNNANISPTYLQHAKTGILVRFFRQKCIRKNTFLNVCKFDLYSKVVIKSIIDPNDILHFMKLN